MHAQTTLWHSAGTGPYLRQTVAFRRPLRREATIPTIKLLQQKKPIFTYVKSHRCPDFSNLNVSAVERLIKLHPDAIASLRSVERAFFKMSADTFDEAGLSDVPADLRTRLVTPFRNYQVA